MDVAIAAHINDPIPKASDVIARAFSRFADCSISPILPVFIESILAQEGGKVKDGAISSHVPHIENTCFFISGML